MVTMSCLLVAFDAILRIPTADATPLCQLMHPTSSDGTRRPAWFPSTRTFSGMDLATRTATCMIVDPHVAHARHKVSAYWEAFESAHDVQPLFSTPERMLYATTHPTLEFVRSLVPATGGSLDELPAGGRLQARVCLEA